MPEPNFAINFTAEMLAAEACEVGDLLVYDSALGRWRVASAANRTSADAGAQAVALSAYGGSLVGRVTYASSGVIPTSVSGLEAGDSALVKTSSAGRFERVVGLPGVDDDIVGYCETDGRIKLHLGIPWTLIVTGGISFGGSNGDVMVRSSATSNTGVSPGTAGNVLMSDGSSWNSTLLVVPAPASPDGAVQYRVDSTTFGAAAGFTYEGDGRLHARTVRTSGGELFTFSAAGNTITRDTGSWIDDGFLDNDVVRVVGSVNNDAAPFVVASRTALVLTLLSGVVNEGPIGSTYVFLDNPAHITVGLPGGTYPEQTSGGGGSDGGLIRVGELGADVITWLRPSGGNTVTAFRVNPTGLQIGSDTSSGGGVVQIYAGDGFQVSSGTSFFELNGPVEQNGNLALLGPVQGAGEWEGGFRVGYLYGVNAGVTAPTDDPTDGVFFWCRDDNQSSAVKAVFWRFEDAVIKIIGSKRSEHQQGRGKIIPLTGGIGTSSTTPTDITELSYDMPDECVCTFDFEITMCRDTAATKGGTYKGNVTYRRTGGGDPQLVGAAVYATEQETTAGDTVTFAVSSNAIRPQVTAADTDGRYWFGEMRVQQVTAS